MNFCHLPEIYLANMENNLYTSTKTGTKWFKNYFQKSKAVHAIGKFLGNKLLIKLQYLQEMLKK